MSAAEIAPKFPNTVEAVIAETQPTGKGQRKRKLHALAAKLAAMQPRPSIPTVIRIVEEWHSRAVDKIRDKDLATTQKDFAEAWKKATKPQQEKPPVIHFGKRLRANIEAAKAADTLPEEAGYMDQRVRLLVRLCHELSQVEQEWKLSCRVAAAAIRCTTTEAIEAMAALVEHGVIAVVTLPDHEKRIATTYRWIGL